MNEWGDLCLPPLIEAYHEGGIAYPILLHSFSVITEILVHVVVSLLNAVLL